MKISVNDKELFKLSETQKAVIQNDIHADEFEDDMNRRLQYILNHKYERCLERLKLEWLPKLKSRVSSFPSDDEQLAKLILSQPDYKCRKTRDDEQKIKELTEKTSGFSSS
jgi:hypothetical protein